VGRCAATAGTSWPSGSRSGPVRARGPARAALPVPADFGYLTAFPLGGAEVQVGASVGVTVSHATEVDDVLREADVAMYTAKGRGKGRFELAASSV
jgi:GGDEF domain-containing protein